MRMKKEDQKKAKRTNSRDKGVSVRTEYEAMQGRARAYVRGLLDNTSQKEIVDPFDDCSGVFVGDCRRGWSP
jgi:hypothetical protein